MQVQIPHRQRGQLHSPGRLAPLLHVSGHCKQLTAGQRAARRRPAHRRARRLEGSRGTLAD